MYHPSEGGGQRAGIIAIFKACYFCHHATPHQQINYLNPSLFFSISLTIKKILSLSFFLSLSLSHTHALSFFFWIKVTIGEKRILAVALFWTNSATKEFVGSTPSSGETCNYSQPLVWNVKRATGRVRGCGCGCVRASVHDSRESERESGRVRQTPKTKTNFCNKR